MRRRFRLAVLLLAVLVLALGRGSDDTPEHEPGEPLHEPLLETNVPAANPESHAEATSPETPADELTATAADTPAEGASSLNPDDAPTAGAPPDEAAPKRGAQPSSTDEASAGEAERDAEAEAAVVARLEAALQEHGMRSSSELLELGLSLRAQRPARAAAILGVLAAFAGAGAQADWQANWTAATTAAVELGHMRLLGEGVERSEAAAIAHFQGGSGPPPTPNPSPDHQPQPQLPRWERADPQPDPQPQA